MLEIFKADKGAPLPLPIFLARGVLTFRLRRFWGLFWPIFDSFCGDCIRMLILSPQKESKIGSKEPKNRQKLNVRLPLIMQAGFPSPAEDYLDKTLDLNELLIAHPAATFFVRVMGDSMRNAGILSGDVLIVDRSLEAIDNAIVIAIINGEFTVKRLSKKEGHVFLVPENPSYPIVEITPESDFQVWGVVTYVIHKAR